MKDDLDFKRKHWRATRVAGPLFVPDLIQRVPDPSKYGLTRTLSHAEDMVEYALAGLDQEVAALGNFMDAVIAGDDEPPRSHNTVGDEMTRRWWQFILWGDAEAALYWKILAEAGILDVNRMRKVVAMYWKTEDLRKLGVQGVLPSTFVTYALLAGDYERAKWYLQEHGNVIVPATPKGFRSNSENRALWICAACLEGDSDWTEVALKTAEKWKEQATSYRPPFMPFHNRVVWIVLARRLHGLDTDFNVIRDELVGEI